MTWFKMDDQFPSHPKVLRAGPDAAWLYVAGGCYCARHLTDGLIPKCAVATLTTLKNAEKLGKRLVEVGLWVDHDDDYEVNDYLEYNPSREKVLSERKARSMAGAMGAAKRWDGKRHGMPHDDRIDNVDAPDPTRPDHGKRARPKNDFTPTAEHESYAKKHGLDLATERDGWITWCDANGKTYARLNAGFSTWLQRSVEFGRGKKQTDLEAMSW